jgi:3-phenylpropionate/cinnamic acid dioxygenase small subunit
VLRIANKQGADDLTYITGIREFLFHEARLMDEGRYAEWLALWTEDALYWVPCNQDDIDPRSHVSIIYDDRERLEQRVERLLSGSVLAVEPRPRMRRIISNIEMIENDDGTIAVEANFIVGLARSAGQQQLWIGRSQYQLLSISNGYKISRKKVLLINSDQEIPLLQFLI